MPDTQLLGTAQLSNAERADVAETCCDGAERSTTSCHSHTKIAKPFCSILERLLWLAAAAAVLFYGNGHHDLFTVALHHPDVWR